MNANWDGGGRLLISKIKNHGPHRNKRIPKHFALNAQSF